MQQVDCLLVNAAQVVTCAGGGAPKRGAALADCGVIPHGAVALRNGRLVAVGTSADILRDYTADALYDLRGKVLIPGLVDCHTHVVFAGDRLTEWELRLTGTSYLDILAAGGGILSTMRATRAAPSEALYQHSQTLLDLMLQEGTTTAEIKTGYGLETAAEVKCLEVIAHLAQSHAVEIVPTFLGAHAVPPEYAGQAAAYVEVVINEMLPQVQAWQQRHAEHVARVFVDVFCEQKAFSLAQTQQILAAGKAAGMLAKAHVDEFNDLGAVLALAGQATSLDHLDVTPPAALQHLAQTATFGIMLPAVNFHLGSAHYGNARALIDAGGLFALATDVNPGSAPCLGLPFVMALACRYQHLRPAEALNAVTLNAAYAIGMGEQVGSLEVGKQADLVVLQTDDYRQMAYQFGGSLVEQVWKRGVQVV